MRPRTLDELVGQDHLLVEGSPLRRLVEDDQPMSVMLWGPPGTGKTTVASLLSRGTGRDFVELSAVSAGVKEVRAVLDAARRALVRGGRETVLFVDEVHRFSKTQQDALLPGVENRLGVAGRRHHREPALRDHRPAAVPVAAADPAAARADERGRDAAAARGRRRARAGRRASRIDDEALDHLVRLAGGDGRRGADLPGGGGARRPARAAATVVDVDTAALGRRPGRGALRPRRRPALRRHLRADQVDPRAPTSTPPCTTWPGWSRRARTRASWPGGW